MLRRCWIIIASQNSKIFFILFFLLFSPVKSWALFEKVFSSSNEIVVDRTSSLKINSSFPNSCFDDVGLISRVDCFPQNNLCLTVQGKKIDYSYLLKYWTHEFVYFIKISPKGYLDDLDGDGNPEIALYPMVAGNNPITDAYIYSVVENKLVLYGMGRFHFEWGPYVKNIEKGKWVEPNP